MTRVPCESTSSPFMLNVTLRYHFNIASEDKQHMPRKLLISFCVDDRLIGPKTIQDVNSKSKLFLKDAGIQLR